MRSTRLAILGILAPACLGLSGCGALTQGLGSFTSEGLVDEYTIPQNRSLATPTDFSLLPVPQNKRDSVASLPSPEEIEALMFQLEPEPEPEYVPLTIIQGEVPAYRPIGRIVASGSNGAASQPFVSTSTNAGGSLFPIAATSSPVPSLEPSLEPSLGQAAAAALTLPMTSAAPTTSAATLIATDPAAPISSTEGLVVLSPEDVAALSALAVGQAQPVMGVQTPTPSLTPTLVPALTPMAVPQASMTGAQMVTSLPDGVTVVGSPVVLPR